MEPCHRGCGFSQRECGAHEAVCIEDERVQACNRRIDYARDSLLLTAPLYHAFPQCRDGSGAKDGCPGCWWMEKRAALLGCSSI